MAILGADGAGRGPDTLADLLVAHHVQLLWHPSFSMESPQDVVGMIDRILSGEQPLTLLCIEGSIICGPHGTGRFDTLAGHPKKDMVASLCAQADYVLAMGSCAAFGGIPAAPPNPTQSCGLQFTNDQPGGLLDEAWRSKAGLPVLNLAGCPVDAATMINTMRVLLQGGPIELDRHHRPLTVRPCLSDASQKTCGTAGKVGYSCYGCIGARFPMNKSLFRHVPQQERALVAL
jgi:hydrogenase small subunit